MNWAEVQRIFDRAAQQTLDIRRLFFTFAILVVGGLIMIFCRSIAIHAGTLVALSLAFMPFFVCAAILFAAGIMLVRIYHDSLKKKKIIYRDIFYKSWSLMMGASYFSIPVILSYLVLWMLLGLFYLLKEIPYLGEFFSVVLVFGPFLLNLGALVLCLINIGMLFFLTPIIALRGINRLQISQILSKRIKTDLFSHLILLIIGLLPLVLTLILLHSAFHLTGVAGFVSRGTLQSQMQWFFMMIPYAACLSPATVFFFNFATESHVLMQDLLRRQPI